jgi:hypothetical protein
MKRFDNTTAQQKISDAILIAESLLTYNSKMLIEISKKDDFKYSSGKGVEVALALYAERSLVKVFTYKPKWVFSKAIGYSDGKAIYVNIRKLPERSVVDVAANLLHEYAHHCGFGHDNNFKTQEKVLFSVPYYLSENIENWL